MTATDASLVPGSRPLRLPRASSASAAGAPAVARTGLPWPVTVYLLCVVLPISFNAGPLALTILRAFLIVMILPVLGKLLLGRYGKTYLTDYLFVLHIGWAAVALAMNNPDHVVEQVGSVGVEFLGGYAIGRAYIRTPEAFIALARRLVLIVLCILPFALQEAVTGRPMIIEFIRSLPGVGSVEIVTIEGRMGIERVQAVFAHPIHFGLFCSVAFSLSFVVLKGFASNPWRYLSSSLMALSGFLALSSGALLAMVLQLSLIAWYSMLRTVEKRWWILVGLGVVAYVFVDLFSNRTPLRVFMSYATFSAHNAYWRGIIFEWGMKSVWAHPLYGIGLNDWVRPSFMHSGSMDNFWLVMAVRYGIPGFLTLAIGYALGVVRIMRLDFAHSPLLAQIRRAWVFTLLGLSFTLCTVHIWTNVYSFVMFMFGAGLWLVAAADAPAADADAAPASPRGAPTAARRSGVVPASPAAAPAAPERPRTATEAGPAGPAPAYSRFPSVPAAARPRPGAATRRE